MSFLDFLTCLLFNFQHHLQPPIIYQVESGDTLFRICSRFQVDIDKTAMFNRLENPNIIHAGDAFKTLPGLKKKNERHRTLRIPISVAILQNGYSCTAIIGIIYCRSIGIDSSNTLSRTVLCIIHPIVKRESKSSIRIVFGSTLAAFTCILLTVALLFCKCYKRKGTSRSKVYPRRLNCLRCYLGSCQFHAKFEESVVSSFSSEKATVFPYHEVRDATSNFSTSLKIGQGSYGSVYLGKLRGMDVAIKQMKNTKSKEFLSELNILCRVHHSNLIELTGYAAGGESLFLIYEYAQNGAMSDHLHKPSVRGVDFLTNQGYKPLAWTTRVQIALDAAKGLEYIHEHTKPYYVHRDVKTSNILLDSNFRAKIADFGLVKLLEHSPEVAAAASRIVGTFGYLAPE
ncbi:hypothetical protein Patl1_12448 [Pistacia atlantica]|uniref:Uncharacterized protein n=1 Tax=Pistacia atlantica TaxID=434234 RepID=A0ACC1AUU4_9ROSI|nr:hypothetical protein Patl1_12448 [Pistacia atlantica]